MRRVRTVWIIKREVPRTKDAYGGVQYWHRASGHRASGHRASEASRWTRVRLAATEYTSKDTVEKLAFKLATLDPTNIGRYEVVRVTEWTRRKPRRFSAGG